MKRTIKHTAITSAVILCSSMIVFQPVSAAEPEGDAMYSAEDQIGNDEISESDQAADKTETSEEDQTDADESEEYREPEGIDESADEEETSNLEGETETGDGNSETAEETGTGDEKETGTTEETGTEDEKETETTEEETTALEELSKGMSGENVMKMQMALQSLGYLTVNPDGIFGGYSEAAVKAFQIYNGLDVTGIADIDTLTLIYDEEGAVPFSSLNRGTSGNTVYTVQCMLADYGYLTVKADGSFGSNTENAVKKFQMYNNLNITGSVDSETLRIMLNGSGKKFSVLRKGAQGKTVYTMQKMLYDLGYLPVSPDGSFGSYTEAALIAFQADQGLSNPDGAFGNWTFGKLINCSSSFNALSAGSKGTNVRIMQKKLQQLGFLSVAADGIFGAYSTRAVKKFQMYAGFEITGIADAATLNAIYRSAASMYSLSKGSKGAAVLGLQKELQKLGYLSVDPDGSFGNYTVQALKDFQTANSLLVDGVLGKYSLEILFKNPVAYSEYMDSVSVEYGGTYFISTALGRKVIEIADASVYAGANAQLYTKDSGTDQKWVLQSAGDDYYYIRNLKSWKCLDISENNVQQSAFDSDSQTQKWTIQKNPEGGYYIINANGMYLNVSGGKESNGANVSVSDSADGSSQIWYLAETDSGTALNFKSNGLQSIGIRSFSISDGNVTETSAYYPILTDIVLPSGGYYLSGGSNYSIGLKVMYINNYLAYHGYLSTDYYNYERYDNYTAAAVRQFQEDNGLVVDGLAGLQTWTAMGYSESDYYNLGSYVTNLKVYAYGSSRNEYVNAMLETAEEYASAGTGYRVGCSGEPGTWVDCSGLIYQCLYAAGINPDTNIIDHARVVYEYTSAYLADDSQLGASVSMAEPGDLIFYGGSSVNHVAIYAGNGMIYDAYPGLGVTYRSMYIGTIQKIVRVF